MRRRLPSSLLHHFPGRSPALLSYRGPGGEAGGEQKEYADEALNLVDQHRTVQNLRDDDVAAIDGSVPLPLDLVLVELRAPESLQSLASIEVIRVIRAAPPGGPGGQVERSRPAGR